jgi:hypothetical protein
MSRRRFGRSFGPRKDAEATRAGDVVATVAALRASLTVLRTVRPAGRWRRTARSSDAAPATGTLRRARRNRARGARAAVRRRRACPARRNTRIACAYERRRTRWIRNARTIAAICARCARCPGRRRPLGCTVVVALGSATRDPEGVLLAVERVSLHGPRAAAIGRVAGVRRETADRSGGATGLAVVTTTDGSSRSLAAMDVGGLTGSAFLLGRAGHAWRTAAVGIALTELARRMTAARRLADERSGRRVGPARTAAAFAPARWKRIAARRAATDLPGRRAVSDPRRRSDTAQAERCARDLRTEPATAVEVVRAGVPVLGAERRCRTDAAPAELRATLSVRSTWIAGRLAARAEGDAFRVRAFASAAFAVGCTGNIVRHALLTRALAANARERAALVVRRTCCIRRCTSGRRRSTRLRRRIAVGSAAIGARRAGCPVGVACSKARRTVAAGIDLRGIARRLAPAPGEGEMERNNQNGDRRRPAETPHHGTSRSDPDRYGSEQRAASSEQRAATKEKLAALSPPA